MPKRYEQMSTIELEFELDYSNLTDEDEARILTILKHREAHPPSSLLHSHEEREEEEE